MKRKCNIFQATRWILLFTLLVSGMSMFEAKVVKAARTVLTSEDKLWKYECIEETSGETVVSVDGYNGSDRDLVIPEEIDGYKVRYIGNPGGMNSVKTNRFDSITIPDSITGLYNVPFFTHSHNLKYIYLGKNYGTYSKNGSDITMIRSDTIYDIQTKEYRVSPENTVITSVDGVLYSKDMTTLKLYPALKEDTTFTIPNSVTSLGNSAMNTLQYLENLVLPDGLQEIGQYCFQNSSIRSVNLPNGLTILNHGVFYGAKLESIVLPNTIETIGASVFRDTPLKEVVIPDTVISLGNSAFMDCDQLKSIEIGSGLKSIGGNCFYGLTSLETFKISEKNPYFKSENGMLLTKDGSTLIQYASADNTKFILPNGVTVIGTNACYGMPFDEIIIPDTIKSIGDEAFKNCTKAEKVYVPSSVKTLGSRVFSGCTALKTAAVDAPVTTVNSAFSNCSSLVEVRLPETITSVNDVDFFGESLRYVYLKSPKAPSISYSIYLQGQDAETELIKKSSNIRIFVPEDAQGYDTMPWSRMHIIYGDIIAVERLTLNPSAVFMNEGETVSVHPVISPEDATVQDLVWDSSNEEIASVDTTGQIAALSAGTATIKVTTGDVVATCIVTVRGNQEAQNFREETSGGTASSNRNAQNYTTWSQPIKSYLFGDENGDLTRVEFIGSKLIYETYDMNGALKDSGSIANELSLTGGFYVSGTYRFVVYGQSNSSKSDSAEVIRIVKYGKDWSRISSCSIYGENTTKPFDAGNLRFAESGDMLYIRTSHTMYDGHQSNLQIAVDMSAMTVKDILSETANIDYGGYVSHSFNQFLQMDGEDLITLDHGDTYPRAAVLVKYPNIKATTYARASVEHFNALEFSGMAGNNYTGASLGGLEVSEHYYIFAGNNVNDSNSSVRNIFVNITDKDFLQNPDTQTIYLTDYKKDSGVTVSTPQLVKVNEKTFLVLWNETDESGITVHCQMIDENGNKITPEQSFHGSLSDCQPIMQNGQVVWYYTGTAEEDTTPIICRIAVDGKETSDNLLDGETDQKEDSEPEDGNDTGESGGSGNTGDNPGDDNDGGNTGGNAGGNNDGGSTGGNAGDDNDGGNTGGNAGGNNDGGSTGGNTGSNTDSGNSGSNTGTSPNGNELELNVKTTELKLTGISKKIAAGKKIALTPVFAPVNVTNQNLVWISSNTKYATVNSKGVVTTKKKGAGKSVTITATAQDGSNIKATYKITIMKHAVKSIKLTAKNKTVQAGKKLTLKATVKTTGKNANKVLQWTSSNTEYATVSKKGVVSAKKAGKGKTVKITAKATDGTNKKATIKIKIK